jgi:hypothetical protein
MKLIEGYYIETITIPKRRKATYKLGDRKLIKHNYKTVKRKLYIKIYSVRCTNLIQRRRRKRRIFIKVLNKISNNHNQENKIQKRLTHNCLLVEN